MVEVEVEMEMWVGHTFQMQVGRREGWLVGPYRFRRSVCSGSRVMCVGENDLFCE